MRRKTKLIAPFVALALVAALLLAGLAEGVWASVDEVGEQWGLDAEFTPTGDRTVADARHGQWLRAVERSRNWVL